MNSPVILQPQEGRQTEFLACRADICIYGGAAGGGKSFGLLLDAVRYAAKLPIFNGVIFRRLAADLTKPGALWDESKNIYTLAAGYPNNASLSWRWARNSKIKLAGLQLEQDVMSWQGAQLDFLGFDELTHFSEHQFWYLIGRMRSTSGKIKPYCRATCNPENNWVYELIKWWIKSNGYPDISRAGKIRWFYRFNDEIFWFDNRVDAVNEINQRALSSNIRPLSLSFIPATLSDNKILLKNSPSYYAALAQLPEYERSKLLDGNWKVRPIGKLFSPKDFQIFVIPPREPESKMIFVDTAMSTKTANDFTVMQRWSRYQNCIYLEKQIRGRFDFGTQLQVLCSLIMEDKPNWVVIEKAATGISLIQELRKRLAVPLIEIDRHKDKYTRGFECQGYVQSGYVFVNPHADYYADFMSEVSNFSPENKNKLGIHDDQVDCMLDAIYYMLINNTSSRDTDLKDFYKDSEVAPWT